MILFPHAKINLGLYITKKRKDGFHELETCFVPVPWTDILEITQSEQFAFTSSGLAIDGPIEKNLCYRAFEALKADHNIPNVHIHLHKVIPMGAGLGGGSSDASFTLKGLRDLFKLPISDENLLPYAAQLGSDCAFFIQNQAQLGSGRGEILSPIDLQLVGKYMVLIYPNFGISTQEAFAGISPKKAPIKLAKILKQPMETWKSSLSNDFEESLFPAYPILDSIKAELYSLGANYATMSGSGSTIVGLFDHPVSVPDSWKSFVKWEGFLP
jgi:4-diphosphocytidyl-2-C-methyl-D-erythritol kinase